MRTVYEDVYMLLEALSERALLEAYQAFCDYFQLSLSSFPAGSSGDIHGKLSASVTTEAEGEASDTNM